MSWEDGAFVEENENIDEYYILNAHNSVQLVSSLAFFLRERNYVCLYDTSILSSPERYLRKNSIDEINKDYLYKWFLFFTGIFRHLSNFDNLILLPEVVEEISNILRANISAIEKKKEQYKTLSSQEREEFSQVYHQLAKNEEVINKILAEISARPPENPQPSILNAILKVVKFLDLNLELKKADSRTTNDTDERIVARLFYEVLINGHNVCVYTRDDDIRKLVSVTFRLLVSKFIQREAFKHIFRNLSHLNMLVLKYNYDKKVFSRFFESSTLENVDEFIFPRKITQCVDVNKILNGLEQHVVEVTRAIESFQQEDLALDEDGIDDEEIIHSLKNIYRDLNNLELKEDSRSSANQIFIYQELSFLLRGLGEATLANEVMEATKQQQKKWMENRLGVLYKEKQLLEEEFAVASSHQGMNYKTIQRLKKNVDLLQENILQIYFYESALTIDFFQLDDSCYQKFKDALSRFHDCGFEISVQESPVPIEKICELMSYSLSKTVEIIEKFDISHEGTYAYLSQKHFLFFLFGIRTYHSK